MPPSPSQSLTVPSGTALRGPSAMTNRSCSDLAPEASIVASPGAAELVTGRSLRLPAQVQEPVELLWHISQLGHAPPDHAGRPTEQLDLEPVCQSLVTLRTQHEIGRAGRPLGRCYEPDKLVPVGPERALVHLKIRQPPVAELAHQQRALASGPGSQPRLQLGHVARAQPPVPVRRQYGALENVVGVGLHPVVLDDRPGRVRATDLSVDPTGKTLIARPLADRHPLATDLVHRRPQNGSAMGMSQWTNIPRSSHTSR